MTTDNFLRFMPLCVAALVLAGCGKEEVPAPVQQSRGPALLADKTWPNVVLISISSLRPDHLHCYGYPKDTSPNIDRFAAEGALFENAISSSPWSLPAHAAMFTGLCDSVHGCTEADRRLNDDLYTLAEWLKEAGFVTAGFFSGPFLHPAFGLSAGFDTYVDCMWYPPFGGEPDDASGAAESLRRDITSPKVVAEVQRWLRANTRRPFFMFIQFWDVNFDYIPPPPYDTKFDPDYAGDLTGERFLLNPKINKNMPPRDLEHLRALYDGEIGWTDEHFGRIVKELGSLKLLDSSIVFVTSDNGTALLEHGLRGQRNSLFDELIRIPLIIRYPTLIEAGQRYKQQVRTVDLLPTVLGLLGLRSPVLMGQSLAPLFTGDQLAHREPAVSELYSMGFNLQSYRVPERKTIWNLDADAGLVYDLRSDPGELTPVTGRDAPAARAARAEIHWSRAYLKSFRERYQQSPSPAELPPELQEKFKSLGYVNQRSPEPAPVGEPAPAP